MTLTVGEFKQMLRRAHKRGTALDNELDGAMRRAAQWVEANKTLQYMRQRFELYVEPNTNYAEVPDVGVKAVLNLQYRDVLDYDDKPLRVNKVTQASMNYNIGLEVPDEFYLDGQRTMIFNGTFREQYNFVGMLARFSDFPKRDNDTHFLLNHAESLMLTQSMLELGLFSRDSREYQIYSSHRQDQMTVLQNADDEAQYAGAGVIYAPQ
jgi:hypothetical protein